MLSKYKFHILFSLLAAGTIVGIIIWRRKKKKAASAGADVDQGANPTSKLANSQNISERHAVMKSLNYSKN